MTARILIVDDEEIVVRSCRRILDGSDYAVDAASNGFDALRLADERPYDVVVLDIMMPRIDGLEVLQQLKERHPEVDVIMITGLAQVQTAVQAMKLGAFDYLSKPFDPDELVHVVGRALERRRLLQHNRSLLDEVGTKYRFENIVGAGAAMQAVYRLVARCAPTNTTVLITGESGTGKGLIARAIHYNSLRRERGFVTVDCSTLNENLLESELFGHVKGAFTGAVAHKRGMFEVASDGTMFLDEIGNIAPATQAKLLRVIQDREFRAVGSTTTQTTNARLIAATNKDLLAMVAEGTFREDLYYRINVFPIHAPPLRERRDDIPALAYHFVEQASAELGKPVPEISEGAMSALVNHAWPGNVRELENAIRRALILCPDRTIRRSHLAGIGGAEPHPAYDVPRTSEDLKRLKQIAREKSVEEIERQFVLEALQRNGSNVTRSAQDTGMLRSNFQALMRKHGIRVRDTSPDADGGEAG